MGDSLSYLIVSWFNCFIPITYMFDQLVTLKGKNRYSSPFGPKGFNYNLLQYLSDATKTEWTIEAGNWETITSE